MTCAHRYRYDEPTGPTSVGVCALCGATRTDSNVFVQDRAGPGYRAMRRQLYDIESKARTPRKRRRQRRVR